MDEQTRTAGSDVEDDCFFFMKQEGRAPTGILINIYTRSYKKKLKIQKKKVRKKIASITQSCLAMDQG
jgi:hypothetical protein